MRWIAGELEVRRKEDERQALRRKVADVAHSIMAAKKTKERIPGTTPAMDVWHIGRCCVRQRSIARSLGCAASCSRRRTTSMCARPSSKTRRT